MQPTTRIQVLTLAAASLLLVSPARAQRGGGTQAPPATNPGTQPGGNTGGRGPSPGNTPNSPNTIGNQPNAPTNPRINQPIYISGRVMMDDGSELPPNVDIERFCGNNPHTEGHTDSKGYFNIQLGTPNADVLPDASESGYRGFGQPDTSGASDSPFSNNPSLGQQRSLANCELRARLAGYVSQTVLLYDRQPLDNPEIGTILLHRIAPTEGTTVSATTLNAPKNARKALQKGLNQEKKKKLDEAQSSFGQAVQIDPKFAEAWLHLGRVQAQQGNLEAAHHSFDQAIAADAKFVPPYIQISLIEYQAQHWQQLADVTGKAMQLDSFSYPQAFLFNAVANYNLQREDAAAESVKRVLHLDTRHQYPQASQLLGLILADRHDYSGAAAQMRDYLKYAPQAKDAPTVRAQIETFEKQSAVASQPQH